MKIVNERILKLAGINEASLKYNDKIPLEVRSFLSDVYDFFKRDGETIDIENEINIYGSNYYITFRTYRYFTTRRGEEDDDHPDFTGERELESKLDKMWKDVEKLGGKTYSGLSKKWKYKIQPQEKNWIDIYVVKK